MTHLDCLKACDGFSRKTRKNHRNLFCKNPLSEATISQIQDSRQDLLWPSHIHLFLADHIAHKTQMKVLLASVVLFTRVQVNHSVKSKRKIFVAMQNLTFPMFPL
ncbi:atp-dependent clp protease atp-binding subunit clpx [Gossypium arboreum]|uniref:Atp-dependent clp protease atp-binding subunit clpx n=1 Tax=Gossypium arboreum TaxID=29729 RepID=A0A0B0MTU1_GOSAR|nr:atp-dependent clp protease atp-binding subunit clpx [Gossypium arboreum]